MSNELPEGWRTVRLGDVAVINPDSLGQRTSPDFAFGYIDISQIDRPGVCLGWTQTTFATSPSRARRMVRENDIIVSTVRPYLKAFAKVPTSNEPLVASTGFAVVRAYKEADQEFLFQHIMAADFIEHLTPRMTGSNYPAVSADDVSDYELRCPPLDEQQRIAEVLRSVDEAAEALEASLSAALSVRQATLNDLMRREASSAENWPLDAVADVRTGLTKNAGREGEKVSLPYLRVANVQDGWIDLSVVKTVDVDPAAISRYSLQPGDVLLTEGGDYDKLGRGGVWTGEIDPCLHQNHVFAVRPDRSRLSSEFLALLTQSYLGRAYFLSCAKRTTNLASINSSQLKKLPVPVLPLSRQQEIASEIGSIDRLIATEKERAVALRRLRKALSHDLLSGRVRVPAIAPTTSTVRAVQPAFKRAVFAAEVVHQLHNDDRFGSVKHEKIVHLCELHLRLQDDLDRHAYKEAAGPYDPSARRSVERIFRQQKWFDPTKQDKRVVYQPLEASGGHARYFDRYFGDRKAEVQKIIDLLRPLTTQQCEIIATLYAVWNDFLIDAHEPGDDEIVDGVLNNWTDSKRQIPEEKWRAALPWMRQKELIPTGHGEKTRVAAT